MQNFEICRHLLEIKAIKLNVKQPFTWASGIKSPIYCDNRVTLSHPKVRNAIKRALADLSKQFGDFDFLAGVATAGIAHGALLADYLEKPFCYVRSEAKSHGRQNQIEGDLQSGVKVLVVEDLISTGGSSIQVVDILRKNNVEVVGVIAIFDYGFEAAAINFEQAHCPYKALATYSNLIDEAIKMEYVSSEDLDVLKIWNADAKNWYNDHFSKL
jgi:orotate phosphoribosyltransferase